MSFAESLLLSGSLVAFGFVGFVGKHVLTSAPEGSSEVSSAPPATVEGQGNGSPVLVEGLAQSGVAEPRLAAAIKAEARTGRLPRSGVAGADAFGNAELKLDNGVTASTRKDPFGGSATRYSNGVTAETRPDPLGGSTTRYSNGVTASTRPDPLGGTSTSYSDGTRSTTRTDPLGNQVTTFSDGRIETIRPDPFAPHSPPRDTPKATRNDRK